MSIYYMYAPDVTKTVVLSYVDDYVYWYTSESLGKWFVDTLGKRLHVNFLWYSHWFMLIRISHMKDHSIYVDQAFIIPLCHLIRYSPKHTHLPVMKKLIIWLNNSKFTIELASVHWFINCLQEWIWVFQCTS